MSLAIITSYMGPTNSRGSRVKAVARKAESWGDNNYPAMSITDSWNSAENIEENHCRAAKMCVVKYGWNGVYVAGSVPGGGYAFVDIGGHRADHAALVALLEQSGKVADRDFFTVAPKERD